MISMNYFSRYDGTNRERLLFTIQRKVIPSNCLTSLQVEQSGKAEEAFASSGVLLEFSFG